MIFDVPLPSGALVIDSRRIVYAPGFGRLGQDMWVSEHTVPCGDCILEDGLEDAPPMKVLARERSTQLATIVIQEVFYEGKCDRCNRTTLIVSLVRTAPLGFSLSSSQG